MPDLIFDFRFINIGYSFNERDLKTLIEVMFNGIYDQERINDYIIMHIHRNIIPVIEQEILRSIRKE